MVQYSSRPASYPSHHTDLASNKESSNAEGKKEVRQVGVVVRSCCLWLVVCDLPEGQLVHDVPVVEYLPAAHAV